MLISPAKHQTLKLISVDPGLNNVGVAIFDIDMKTQKPVRIRAMTLCPPRLIDDSILDDEVHEERLFKRYRIASAWKHILDVECPDRIACESPFFDRRKPSSFAVLTEVMTTLLDVMLTANPQLKMKLVPPLVVKQYLGVAGQKGKEVIRDAMAKRSDVLAVLEPSLDLLTEHAIDAVGVGLTYLDRFANLSD